METDNKQFLPYIDIEDGMKRVVNNSKLYKKLLNNFLDPKHINALKDHLNQNDYLNAEHDAHAIKGIAANLSLKYLFSAVEKLDNSLKLGAPDESILNEFNEALSKTEEYVKTYLES